jgi:GDSL-like Lipase/Acylhydrolase family
MPFHIALLGDSIFDNVSYTRGEPDVLTHLRSLLPAEWRASLFAADGSVSNDLTEQLPRVTTDVTHLVISVGGNDALMYSDLLHRPVLSTADALRLFRERVDRFEIDYRTAIDGALTLGRPTTTCTIYNGNLPAAQAATARIALMMFNDVILRVAFEHHSPVIDLRLICNEPADYANPIEPSGRGGRKIAEAIARTIGAVGGTIEQSRVYAGQVKSCDQG